MNSPPRMNNEKGTGFLVLIRVQGSVLRTGGFKAGTRGGRIWMGVPMIILKVDEDSLVRVCYYFRLCGLGYDVLIDSASGFSI